MTHDMHKPLLPEGFVCFIGPLPARNDCDRLRKTIADCLADHEYLALRFADDLPPGLPSTKALGELEGAALCIFEVSGLRRTSLFMGLGYALGLAKPCVCLLRRGYATPDIGKATLIEYSSMQDLSRTLRSVRMTKPILRGTLRIAGNGSGLPGVASVTKALTRKMHLDPSDLYSLGTEYSLSDEQIRYSLDFLRRLGLVTLVGVDWKVTPHGRSKLSQILQLLP